MFERGGPSETGGKRVSLDRIEEAVRVIDPAFLGSPQFEAEALGDELGSRLVCKVETANPIRSFKGRGTDYLLYRLRGERSGLSGSPRCSPTASVSPGPWWRRRCAAAT